MKPTDIPALITARQGKDGRLCQWFLHCKNPHTTTVTTHSILAEVKTCQSCADKAAGWEVE